MTRSVKKTYLIPDLLNIVCSYIFPTQFDPVESLTYSYLFPEKYPNKEYLNDLKYYEEEIVYPEIRKYIDPLCKKFHCVKYKKNSQTPTNYSKWGIDLIKEVIKKFKEFKLKTPIEDINPSENFNSLSNYHIIVKIQKDDQLYTPDNKIFVNCFNRYGLGTSTELSSFIPYSDLTIFWKSIFFIIKNYNPPFNIADK